jgi:hypothetical protein
MVGRRRSKRRPASLTTSRTKGAGLAAAAFSIRERSTHQMEVTT